MPKLDLENIFMYHPPKGNQTSRYHQIREAGRYFADVVVTDTPESAEQTLAIRKIEEAVFWSNASIARNEA